MTNLWLKSGLQCIKVNVPSGPRAQPTKVWRSLMFNETDRLRTNPFLGEDHSMPTWASFYLPSGPIVKKNDASTCHNSDGGILWCKWRPYSLSARASTQKSSGFIPHCGESLGSAFHRPLAVDWCELQTSTYLIKANQQPVTRALWGFCYYTKQLRGSFRLLICSSASHLVDFFVFSLTTQGRGRWKCITE